MEIPEKKKNERINKYVKRVLFQNIVSLNLKPGERLDDAALCAQFNVSRTPIREALLELTQLHLVDIYPQKGTYVSLLNPSLIRQGQYLRMVLEPWLAELACEQKDRRFLTKQRENMVLLQYYHDKNVDRSLEIDQEFHKYFYYVNGMDFLYETMVNATVHLNRMRKLCMMSQDLKVTISAHEEILKAIENGNPIIARTAMEDHLKWTLVDLQKVKETYPEYFKDS